MTQIPLVSVVMAVYNVDRYLDEAVLSILDQSFRDFEFIIIDDGSNDRSGDILAKYSRNDSRVRVHRQPNKGFAVSLNTGCRMAQGAYIARMDPDDVSLPDRFAI